MAQTNPSLQLQAGVQVQNPVELETDLGPYATVAEANAAIITAKRFPGKKIKIVVANVPTEYWWSGGIADVNLIAISTGGSAGLTSFNGRTAAAAMPTAGDYDTFYFTQAQSNNNYQSKFTSQLANLVYRSGDIAGVPSFTALSLNDMPTFTGYVAGAGIVGPSDRAFTAIQKLDGNTKAINKQVGTIFSDDFTDVNTFANNYTITAGTFTSTTISGGTGLYTGYARWKAFKQSSEKCRPVFRYKIGTLNTAGLALIITGVTDGNNLIAHLDTTTSSASVLKLLSGAGDDFSSNITSRLSTLNVALNDIIETSIGVVNNTITVTARNVTTNEFIQIQYTYYPGSGFVSVANQVNHGVFAIASVGGSHVPLKFSCEEKSMISPDYIFIHDSIGRGHNAFDYKYTYTGRLKAMGVNLTVSAGHSDKISDNNNNETFAWIEAVDPYKRAIIVLPIGSNDASAGSATINADYTALVNRVTASGRQAQVVNLLDRAGATAAINSFNAYLFATYGESVWNINGLIPQNSVYFKDGVHPNLSGFDLMSKFFFDKMKTSSSRIDMDLIYERDYRFKVCEKFEKTYINLAAGLVNSSRLFLQDTTSFPRNGLGYIRNNTTIEIFQYNSNMGDGLRGLSRGLLGTAATTWAVNDRVHNILDVLAPSENGTPIYLARACSPGGTAAYGFYWNAPKVYSNEDQYAFGLAASATMRVVGVADSSITITKGSSGASGGLVFNNIAGGNVAVSGYYVLHSPANNYQLLSIDSGYAPIYTGKANRNFIIGSDTDVYRTSNAGADISAQIFIDPARSSTGGIGYAFDTTNGFTLTQGNGTRRIAGASFRPINLVATAGSEAMDLGVYTQIAGASPALRATFNATGLSTLHLQGQGAAPTIAAGAGAGTGPTITITKATDLSGVITVTTGTLPSLGATIATVTFAIPFTTAPKVILYNSGANSSALSGASMVYVGDANTTTLKFDLTSGGTPLNAATTYTFTYFTVQ